MENYKSSATAPSSCVTGLGSYNGASDLLSWVDRKGQKTSYTWGDFHQPGVITYADASKGTFTWSKAGLLTNLVDTACTVMVIT